MKSKSNMFKLTSLLLLGLFYSCTSTRLIDYTELNTADITERYTKRNNSIQSFKGDADITLNYYEAGKLETQKFNANILWNQNDSLAIEMNYGLMGINLADVAKLFVGLNNYVFVTRDNLFLTGLSDDDYLNQLFRIDIPLKKWAPTLFMNCLTINGATYTQSLINNKLMYTSAKDSIIFRNDIELPGKYIQKKSGEDGFNISFTGLIQDGPFSFPQRIVYYNKSNKSEVIIEYKSINVNKRLPKKGFEVKIPSQMEQIIYD